MTTVQQAIAQSIQTNEVVTIPYTPEAFQELVNICEFYTLVAHGGFQFDGGDECARNEWTVILDRTAYA